MHLVEDGHDPLFKLDVIRVWNKHVADHIEPLHPQLRSWRRDKGWRLIDLEGKQGKENNHKTTLLIAHGVLTLESKVPHKGGCQALDEVLLYPPGGGHDCVDHAVLDQVADVLAGAGGRLF